MLIDTALPTLLGLALAGLLLEMALGWPRWLLNTIGHPVIWIGRSISWLEARRWRVKSSWLDFCQGALLSIIIIGVTTATAAGLG